MLLDPLGKQVEAAFLMSFDFVIFSLNQQFMDIGKYQTTKSEMEKCISGSELFVFATNIKYYVTKGNISFSQHRYK